MTDNEQRQMFLTLYELARDQQKIVDETAMLSQALYRAIVETMPSVELDYSKHRRKIDQTGQLKLNAQRLWNLEAIIAELKKAITSPQSGESVRSEDKLMEKLDQLFREPPAEAS
jgi:flagellar biosynthesis chaperone FliJ